MDVLKKAPMFIYKVQYINIFFKYTKIKYYIYQKLGKLMTTLPDRNIVKEIFNNFINIFIYERIY